MLTATLTVALAAAFTTSAGGTIAAPPSPWAPHPPRPEPPSPYRQPVAVCQPAVLAAVNFTASSFHAAAAACAGNGGNATARRPLLPPTQPTSRPSCPLQRACGACRAALFAPFFATGFVSAADLPLAAACFSAARAQLVAAGMPTEAIHSLTTSTTTAGEGGLLLLPPCSVLPPPPRVLTASGAVQGGWTASDRLVAHFLGVPFGASTAGGGAVRAAETGARVGAGRPRRPVVGAGMPAEQRRGGQPVRIPVPERELSGAERVGARGRAQGARRQLRDSRADFHPNAIFLLTLHTPLLHLFRDARTPPSCAVRLQPAARHRVSSWRRL